MLLQVFSNPQVGQVILQAAQGLSSVFQRQQQLVARQREREDTQQLQIENAKAKEEQQKITNDRLQARLELAQTAETRAAAAAPFQQRRIEAEAALKEAELANLKSGAPSGRITDPIRLRAIQRGVSKFVQDRAGEAAFLQGIGFGEQTITVPGREEKKDITDFFSRNLIFDRNLLVRERRSADDQLSAILGDIQNRADLTKDPKTLGADARGRRELLQTRLISLQTQKQAAQAGLKAISEAQNEFGPQELIRQGLRDDPEAVATVRRMEAAEDAEFRFFDLSKLVPPLGREQFVLDLRAKNVTSISRIMKTRFEQVTPSVLDSEEWVAFEQLLIQTLGVEEATKFAQSVINTIGQ